MISKSEFSLQTAVLVFLACLSLVPGKNTPSITKSNKSFFNLKPATKTEKTNHRVKRSTDFSTADIASLLDRHNYHRSNVDNPTAADMIYMVWDDDLASMAQEWSEMCEWEHGNPTNISPFSSVGQNLWMVGGVSSSHNTDPDAPVDAWYNEVRDYNYDDLSCSAVCGHYTQVVWASSYAVGCGKAFCSSVTSSSFTNAVIVTCNYGPAGNYAQTKPYKSGSACTKCDSGIGECYENQCRLCSDHSEECECKAVCNHCGSLHENCTCTCQNGWYGSDCSTKCRDTHANCGSNPGWYDSSTCSLGSFVPENCPLMCGVCNAADPNSNCDEGSGNGVAIALGIVFTLLVVAGILIAGFFLIKKYKPHLLTRWSNSLHNLRAKKPASKIGTETADKSNASTSSNNKSKKQIRNKPPKV
ncbi:peptidase inhibitor 15-like [Glandiceps talaboti]